MTRFVANVALCCVFVLITGCSGSASSDLDPATVDPQVSSVTSSLLRAMSDGDAATASIYERLVDDRAKQKMTLAQFQAMSQNLISKLGAFKDLDLANRTDVSPGLGRVDVTAFYTAHFEMGDAAVTMAVSKAHDQWRIVSFGLNSPLLSSDPANHRQAIELYVSNSDLIVPGTHASIVVSKLGDKVLVPDALVLNARWKVSLSIQHEGFVTVLLTPTEVESVKGVEDLSLRASK